jgi:hypothetical protein
LDVGSLDVEGGWVVQRSHIESSMKAFTMLALDKDGWVLSAKITILRRPNLAHGKMTHILGIIVHQTGAKSAQSTLDSYLRAGANGAHFLIDKDGSIYQTGSVYWRQWHVGKLRARCLVEHRCSPVETKLLGKMGVAAINRHEMTKSVPKRYPSNSDSIGIELVAGTVGSATDPAYEAATPSQNRSLAWLISELRQNFRVPLTEVFRHPQASYKDPHEAETARW